MYINRTIDIGRYQDYVVENGVPKPLAEFEYPVNEIKNYMKHFKKTDSNYLHTVELSRREDVHIRMPLVDFFYNGEEVNIESEDGICDGE